MSSPAHYRLSPWFWATPIITVFLFTAVMAAAFFILSRSDLEQRQQTLYHDVEWAQQATRLEMRSREERIVGLAREASGRVMSDREFERAARDILATSPDLVMMSWIDANRRVKWVVSTLSGPPSSYRHAGQFLEDPAPLQAYFLAQETQRLKYSGPFWGVDRDVYFELHVPIMRQGQFVGTLAGGYSLRRLVAYVLPSDIASRYQLSLVDAGDNLLASSSSQLLEQTQLSYELPLDPPNNGIKLRAFAFATHRDFIDTLLWTLVVALSAVIIWSLILLARHINRRAAAEFERDRLFWLSQDVLCVLNRRGELVRVNPAFARILNLLEPLADNAPLLNLIHPEDRNGIAHQLEALTRHADQQEAVAFEARCGDGRAPWRWLSWRITVDLGVPDEQIMLYAVAHDVTERKNAEAALSAETAFRRAMENSISIGMRAINMEGEITYVNPAFCRMTGWTESELLGQKPPYIYWPEGGQDHHWESINLLLNNQAPPAGFETRILRKDGQEFYGRIYVSPLKDVQGDQSGWMTSMTDISEPKRIREELASAHERFTKVLETLDAAIGVTATVAETGRPQLLFANRSYLDSFGENPRPFGDFHSQLPGPDARAEQEIYVGAMGQWFDVRLRHIQWVDGRQVAMVVATDVTGKKEAQDLARQQEARLQHTGRLVTMGEMASSLAHELNQPLTAIANYCMGTTARIKTLIRKGETVEPEPLLNALAKTTAQAERAAQVIRRIRDFVKRSEPKRVRSDLHQLVDDARELVDAEASKRRVKLIFEFAPNLPMIDVDPILIAQVLLNLLKNAIDAQTPAGRGEVRMSVRCQGDMVQIAVADRGPGISPERAERLFEPFFTTKVDGMGIGLNICRSIVEYHQGRLWYEPNPGGGALFLILLPLANEAKHATT